MSAGRGGGVHIFEPKLFCLWIKVKKIQVSRRSLFCCTSEYLDSRIQTTIALCAVPFMEVGLVNKR